MLEPDAFIKQLELINDIANQLGFNNVRLLILDNNLLNLLVAVNREHSNADANNAILLESKIIKEFQYGTSVIVESRLKPLEKESIIKNAICIDDRIKIEQAFKDFPHYFNFKFVHLSKFENRQLVRQNKLADDIIFGFFKENKQDINDKMKTFTLDETSNIDASSLKSKSPK